MSEKTKQKSPSMREVIKEFAGNTTAHGISQIPLATNWFWRILWVLAVLAGLSMVLWQSIILILDFLSIPVQSTIEVSYSQTVNFPMVTICNLNTIKVSRLKDFHNIQSVMQKYDNLKNSNESMNASSFMDNGNMKDAMKKGIMMQEDGKESEDSMNDVEVDATDYAKDSVLSYIASSKREMLVSAGHSFKELVFRCSWNGFSCNKGDFSKYWRHIWNWRYGNCYIFNSGATENGTKLPILSISKPGPKFGLLLDLYINQDEYFSLVSQEAGVKVVLTDQRQIPFPSTHGFTVAPGKSTSVGVRKFTVNRIDPHQNNSCYSTTDLEEDSIYSHMKGVHYSVQGCMNSCLANKQQTVCNCTEPKYRSSKEETICMTEKQVLCYIDVIKAYQNNSLGCATKCPQPCKHSSYRYTTSTAQWSQHYEMDFQRTIKKDSRNFGSKMHDDKATMRLNFLRLKIFFEELNLERITYSKSYEIENLLGDIGGQLGLWIGVSVLTIVEVIKLTIDLVHCFIKKMRTRNQRTNVDVIRMPSM